MNNIKKKLIILLSISIITLPLIGCSKIIHNDNKFELIKEYNSKYTKYEVRDKETGVHYYINKKGGMCPVYNFNGSIKSTAEIKK